MSVRVHAPDHPDLPAVTMPDRFRHEIMFFATDVPPAGGSPADHEWWIDLSEAEAVLADGAVRVASPLSSDSRAEIELSEEQENWLEWVVRNGVRRVRLE